MTERQRLLDEVAAMVPPEARRVAVDGVDGVGKTTFAGELAGARMAQRDGSHPDPDHPSLARYVQGQRLYFAACRPWERADVVIDNGDPGRPGLVRD